MVFPSRLENEISLFPEMIQKEVCDGLDAICRYLTVSFFCGFSKEEND